MSPLAPPPQPVSLRVRVAVAGCFFLAAMALPWLGAGMLGASFFGAFLRGGGKGIGGEWAIFGLILGLPMMIGSIVVLVLAYHRVRVGLGLRRSDPAVAGRASTLGALTLAPNVLVLGALAYAESLSYRETGHLDRGETLAAVLALFAVSAFAVAHGLLLRRVARELTPSSDA